MRDRTTIVASSIAFITAISAVSACAVATPADSQFTAKDQGGGLFLVTDKVTHCEYLYTVNQSISPRTGINGVGQRGCTQTDTNISESLSSEAP